MGLCQDFSHVTSSRKKSLEKPIKPVNLSVSKVANHHKTAIIGQDNKTGGRTVSEQDGTKRISDVIGDNGHDGARLHVRDLATAGVQFTVTDGTEQVGVYGEFLLVGIKVNGQRAHFLSSHKAVVQKLRQAVGDLPLKATIRKRRSGAGRLYYDIN